MNSQNQFYFNDNIREYFGTELEQFLTPISEEHPAGEYLRYNGVYQEIKQARIEDDASLPRGIWNYELKRADWPTVSKLAIDALTSKSKDIQLVVWLLEAEIHQNGFRAICPVLGLLSELCDNFWNSIHPQIQDEDIEYRLNPISWIDEKLLPIVRLTPITNRKGSGDDYCWADWIIAKKNETLKPELRKQIKNENPSVEEIEKAFLDTATDYYRTLHETLVAANHSVSYLHDTLARYCGAEAPSLIAFSELLEDILLRVDYELNERGIQLPKLPSGFLKEPEEQDHSGDEGNSVDEPLFSLQPETCHASRRQAYQQLEQTARYLIEEDPHSPAPYLVLKACEWGAMGTRELYQELFMRRQGQIHISELLGLHQLVDNADTIDSSEPRCD